MACGAALFFIALFDIPPMKSASLLLFAALAAPAFATEMAALAKASGCYSCHSPTEKIVGPAFASVAEKYRGDKDAAASLVQSIQYGSKGKWGRVPMPAHPSLSAQELQALAGWVLSTKP